MLNLVILALLAADFLSLVAGVVFLYRFLSRKRLFPQLPRLWKGDRLRFFISGAAFVFLLAAMIGLSSFSSPPAQKAQAQAKKSTKPPLGPSFDGQPPPPMPAKPAPQKASGEERVLPPADQTAKPAPQPTAQPAAPGLPGQQPPSPQPAAPAADQTPQPQASPKAAAKAPEAPAGPTVPPAAAKPGPLAQAQPPQPKPAPAPQAKPADQAPLTTKAIPPQKPAAKAPQAAPKPKAQPEDKAKPKAAPKPEPAAGQKPPAAAKAPKAAPKAGRAYTVCAASFRKLADARREAKKLMVKGFKPQVVTVNLGAKGSWHRICLGSFAQPGKAEAQMKAWQAKGLSGTPFVTRLR